MAGEVENIGIENPLFNILVLDKIFQLCSTKDLTVARSVCQLWKTISSQEIQKRIHFYKIGHQDLNKFIQTVQSSQSQDFPIKSIDLRLSRIRLETPLWRDIFDCFRSGHHGSHFTSIRVEISCCQLPSFFLLLPSFINLVKLEINLYFSTSMQCPKLSLLSSSTTSKNYYFELGHLHTLQISIRPTKSFKIYLFTDLLQMDQIIQKIIESANHLVSLSFINFSTSLIRLIRCSHFPYTLKELQFINSTLCDQDLIQLSLKYTMYFTNLRKLHVKLHENTRIETFHQLLQNISQNLEILQVDCKDNFISPETESLAISKLKIFKILQTNKV